MGAWLLGMFPKFDSVLPGKLMDGMELLTKAGERGDYYAGAAVAAGMILLCMGGAFVCFDRKQL